MTEPHVLDQLEPGSMQTSAVFGDVLPDGELQLRAIVSIAISLRRVADALTMTDNAAFLAGQAFEYGRRSA